jgi:protein TonB
MDKKVLDLIKLETMGNIGAKEFSELINSMQNNKNFPWKELGEYQNLAALLSMVVKQESPSGNVKEKLLNETKNIRNSKSEFITDSKLPLSQNKNLKSGNEHSLKEDNVSDESDSTDETEETGLRIVDHSTEFEEVKSKILKIRDRIKELPESDLHQIENDEILIEGLVKTTKVKNKSSRKKILIGLVTGTIAIAVSGLVYFNLFEGDIEEQKMLAKKETEMLISKSKFHPPKEKDVIITAENVELEEQHINLPEPIELEKEESIIPAIPPEKTEPIEEKILEKPVLPPPQSPTFIEAPLVNEDENNKSGVTSNTTTAQVNEIQLPPKEEKIIEKEPVYFVAVEEMPEPIGGLSAIQKIIIYPEIAKRAGVEGKVLVLAFVDESGNVTKAEVIKGIGLGCDEAAINAVLQTTFKPGKQRGKSVKVKVTIPINFKL